MRVRSGWITSIVIAGPALSHPGYFWLTAARYCGRTLFRLHLVQLRQRALLALHLELGVTRSSRP